MNAPINANAFQFFPCYRMTLNVLLIPTVLNKHIQRTTITSNSSRIILRNHHFTNFQSKNGKVRLEPLDLTV